MGYENGRAKIWRMEAFPSKSQADWEAFLHRLEVRPSASCATTTAASPARCAPVSRTLSCTCASGICATRSAQIKNIRAQQPQHKETIDELLPQVETAFTGPSFSAPFLERAHAAGIARVGDWLNSTGRIVEDQFGRRGPRSTRGADTPLSTSPMDAFINPVRDSIRPRAYGLKNRERTNRMLMLMQLHANRRDDERAYVRHIRDHLESNQGRPVSLAARSSTSTASRRCADRHPYLAAGPPSAPPEADERIQVGIPALRTHP